MVKKFVLFVWVQLLVGSLSAQGWLKNYGTRAENLTIQAIEQTPDGGYFQSGYTFANGSTQLYLAKTDAEGSIIAVNKLKTPTRINVFDGVHVVNAGDGNFIVSYATDTLNNNNINLLKVNQKCKVLWQKSFNAGINKQARLGDSKLLSDNTLASLITVKSSFSDSVAILKTTQQGDLVYFKSITPISNRLASSLVESAAKALFFSSKVNGPSDTTRLYKTDAQSNLIYSKIVGVGSNISAFKTITDLKLLPDGNLAALGSTFAKIDTNGQIIWDTKLTLANYPNNFTANTDGSFSVLATIQVVDNAKLVPNIFLKKFDKNGAILTDNLIKRFDVNATSLYSLYYDLKTTTQGGLIFCGQDGTSSGTNGQVIKINADNILFSNLATGRVFIDNNFNCNLDVLEPNYSNAIIEFSKQGSDNRVIRTRPDKDGNYNASLDAGAYNVQVIPLSDNFVGCLSSFRNNNDFSLDTVRYLGVKPVGSFAQMQVSVSTVGLIKCAPSSYTVSYCNIGTAKATNASVEIKLDSLLNFQNATLPYTKNNRTFTFKIADTDAGACGSFNFTAVTACSDSAIGGQVLSAKAHIFPDTISKGNTAGSYITVDGKCDADSVRFIVSNSGRASTGPKGGVVIRDDVLFLRVAPSLDSSKSVKYSFTKNGKTYRTNVDQVANANGLSTQPTAYVEGCGTDGTGKFSTGYVNQFGEDDADYFIDQDKSVVRDVISAKLEAFPTGYGVQHSIKNTDGIEYLIRFKNPNFSLKPTNDTASGVYIRDTLSAFLNVNSLELGASSHAYRTEIFGENIIKFFIDSVKNTDGEWGFIKFRIQPKTGTPKGTVINNTAYINDVTDNFVASNSVFHTIGENFIITALLDVPEFYSKATVRVQPNPFTDVATFILSGDDFIESEEKTFSVYNTAGQLVSSELFKGNEFTFSRKNLIDNLYIFKIHSHDLKKIASGKLLITK